MLAHLGSSLILVALGVAGMAAAAAAFPSERTRRFASTAAWLFAGLMTAAVLTMEGGLLLHDFSIAYVAQVGSRSAPLWVRAASLWSALEGSILLWGWILSLFGLLLVRVLRNQEPRFGAATFAVHFLVAAFFCLLLATVANPFGLVTPTPLDGPGPNPLLQNHLLMVIHPPILYLGYVGMAPSFALAVGALVTGKLDASRLKILRHLLLIPWIFLTLGIALGSLWAYEVLGWGGFWAWDPVENASLLPWLTATAAIHSLMVSEKRGALKGWTLTLVAMTFLLTVLGTFMTRSGLFNSVHAFSQSQLGPFFLGFLALATLGSIVLLGLRMARLDDEAPLRRGATRDTLFLLNNVLLVTLTLTILLGTVYPLIIEAVSGTRLSVGEPYFDRMAIPLGVALLFLMAIGPALPWGRPGRGRELRPLLWGSLLGLAATGTAALLGIRSGAWLVTIGAAALALTITLVRSPRSRPMLRTGDGWRRLGGGVAHAGLIIALVAIGGASSLRRSQDVTLLPGESFPLGPYTLTARESRVEREPHRQSLIAPFELSRDGERLTTLSPRINVYPAMREPVGTPDVWSSPRADVYLSLLSQDHETGRVGVRAFWNPLVPWIWIGAGLMALGGLVALAARPRKSSQLALTVAPSPAPSEGTDATGSAA